MKAWPPDVAAREPTVRDSRSRTAEGHKAKHRDAAIIHADVCESPELAHADPRAEYIQRRLCRIAGLVDAYHAGLARLKAERVRFEAELEALAEVQP